MIRTAYEPNFFEPESRLVPPRAGTGFGTSGSGYEVWYRVGLGLRQTRVSGSEIFGALHNKSNLRSYRVSGFVGLDQKSGPGFSGLGLM